MSAMHGSSAEIKVLLTVEEVAGQLNLGRTSVFSLIKSGQIASVRIGRARRIPVSEVEAYAARLMAEQCGRSAAA